MIINERGLVKNIKAAYKHGGFNVMNNGQQLTLYTDTWYVRVDWDKFPRKALATLVECIGTLPSTNEVLAVMDKEEPQAVMPDVVGQDVASWETGENAEGSISMVPMIYQGYQLYQADYGGACYGVAVNVLNIVERDIAEHKNASRKGKTRILWEHDGELAILGVIRPTESYWTRDWEQTVWAALEAVDLHKKKD